MYHHIAAHNSPGYHEPGKHAGYFKMWVLKSRGLGFHGMVASCTSDLLWGKISKLVPHMLKQIKALQLGSLTRQEAD